MEAQLFHFYNKRRYPVTPSTKIRGHVFLIILLLFSLLSLVVSCRSSDDGDKASEATATQPPVAQVTPTEGSVEETPTPSPSAEQPDESAEFAGLEELDSCRLEWSVTIETGGSELESSYEMEWVKEPPAYHITMTMGGGGLQLEYLQIAGTTWIKAGGAWVKGDEGETADAFDHLGNIMSPEGNMALTGEETVNGIHCKHYVRDESVPYPMHVEVWVADQSGLPPIVVRGLHRVEANKVVTVVEANVYDINTPISVEPPQ